MIVPEEVHCHTVVISVGVLKRPKVETAYEINVLETGTRARIIIHGQTGKTIMDNFARIHLFHGESRAKEQRRE